MSNYVYRSIIKNILDFGDGVKSRDHKCLFLPNLTASLTSTPLVTIRKTAWRTALREMEWFLSGSTNINDAHPSVHPWWKPWADDKGEVKNSYGKQFRHYGDSNFDQIDYLLRSIAKDPYSRSNIITTWNPKEMEEAPISNCHGSLIKFWAEMDGKLNLTMVQRSCDMIVGVPHNWIQYYALLLWISETLRLPTGRMEWIGLDCHIYSEHLDIAEKIKSSIYGNHFLSEGPKLVRVGNSTDFEADNFKLSGYALNPIVTDKPSLIV